jgi:ribosomal protection tetracycline resistance protein
VRYLNLGIVARVDAGKTTLTERLLFARGVINAPGSVDDGSTQTDFLPLERQRGITIKSAVVSFAIGGVTVNLIDTPGHPDFIAEVERVLGVLDGAILVISAVEGVQVQTRILMRALQRLRIPTLIFVNKIDRSGAQEEQLLGTIAEKLAPAVIAMGSTAERGTRGARSCPYPPDDAGFISRLADLLAGNNDALLEAYVADETSVSYAQLRCELASQTKRALIHPVFFGSAITGAGVDFLVGGIEDLLPGSEGDVDAALSGTVFKVERGPAGEKIAYVRLFAGTVRTRDTVRFGRDGEAKVTAMAAFEHGPAMRSSSASAGQIAKLWGLPDVRIGDRIGSPDPASAHDPANRAGGAYFDPPTLETVVVPVRPADKAALHHALEQLAEQDPLINLRQDDRRGEMYVSLYGEVQKEVIQATLESDYGVDVHFRESSVICIERPVGAGEAAERLGKGGNPFVATVGLRVEPAVEGSGMQLRLEVELVTIPLYIFKSVEEFQTAMEETARHALQQGLCGWQVTDCVVTLTECGYASPASMARDFRLLTPLVLLSALLQAGTQVYEPVQRFRLEMPAETYGTTAPVLARLGAVVRSSTMQGSSYVLEGELRAAGLPELQHQLPAATRGEGVLECSFGGYQPVSGMVPTRPRSDLNPLNRKEYLLHVVRRV